MTTARAALYSAIMVGQQHSPDTSRRASALLDAHAAEVEAAALTRDAGPLLAELRGLHTRYPDSPHCKHDGERWPCLTLRALDAPTEAAYTPEVGVR